MENILSFNYVFFNYPYDGVWPNEDSYYSICMNDLRYMENVQLVNYPMESKNILLRFLQRAHNSGRIRKYVNLPCKKMWYPYYFNTFDNNRKLCFIFTFHMDLDYLQYLKSVYRDSIFVVLNRDLICTDKQWYNEYINSGLIDYWISYDKGDAEKYHMYYYPQMQSKIDIPSSKINRFDVFFVGRAKNRLKKLVEVYDFLTASGLSCFFYIVGAENNSPKRSGIVYSRRTMSYKKMLIYNLQAKCLLDINQKNAKGYTSRFMEAVLYNKKLLTDNLNIKNDRFYCENYIHCFNEIKDISIDFVNSDIVVNYNYQDEFSPKNFIYFLDRLLANV